MPDICRQDEEISHMQADGFWGDNSGFQDSERLWKQINQGNRSIDSLRVVIRTPRIDDIPAIVELIGQCRPYLTQHGPFLYFIYTHCFRDTCAVAVENERIVGWCSMLPVSDANYFLHQLGVVPESRGRGTAFELFAYQLTKLRERHPDGFTLQFTTDRQNSRVHNLNRKVAQAFDMQLRLLPEAVPDLGDGCDEQLYEMTFLGHSSASPEAHMSVAQTEVAYAANAIQ